MNELKFDSKPPWFLEARGREEYLRQKLKLWFREKYPTCIFGKPKKFFTVPLPNGNITQQIIPEIDLPLVVNKEMLIGCQIKFFKGRKIKWVEGYKNGKRIYRGLARIFRGFPRKKKMINIDKEKIWEERSIFEADKNLYEVIGQALLSLNYVHQSYIVIPRLPQIIPNISPLLETTPLGLITFEPRNDQEIKFFLILEARETKIKSLAKTLEYNFYGGNQKIIIEEILRKNERSSKS